MTSGSRCPTRTIKPAALASPSRPSYDLLLQTGEPLKKIRESGVKPKVAVSMSKAWLIRMNAPCYQVQRHLLPHKDGALNSDSHGGAPNESVWPPLL